MIAIKKIIENLKGILGIKKKNGFSKSWKSELDGYGAGQKKKRRLPFDLGKVLGKRAIWLRSRSHISRTEKRKRYSLKLARIIAILVCIVIAVAVAQKPAMHYAASLEFFKIKEIWVHGCSISKVAELKELGNFDYNQSLFSLRIKKAEALLVSHPWIKSASVKKIWPDGISVEVKEHRAAALLIQGDPESGKMYYINSLGESIAPVNIGDEIDYPVITGLHNILEDQRESALREAAEFLRLIAQNNPNLPAQSVSELNFDTVEGMVVRLVDFPFPIYFGRGEVKKKYRQLRNVLAVLYKKQKKNIDISKVEYIRMEYMDNKVLVAQSKSG